MIRSKLAMTCRTARRWSDVVFLDQPLPERELILGRLILHAVDIFARPDETLRRAVAFKTPVHVQRGHAPGERHLIDAAMAGGATDSLAHVNAVIEINEARQIVDPRPFNRLAGAETFPDRRQRGTLRPDLRMAVHADLGRRNPGKRAFLN